MYNIKKQVIGFDFIRKRRKKSEMRKQIKSEQEKIHSELFPLAPGEAKYRGYIENLVKFTLTHQLLDADTWKMFADQFRLHSDSDNCWRGEYWGKMMRGGCMT